MIPGIRFCCAQSAIDSISGKCSIKTVFYNDKEHIYDLVDSVKGTKIALDFAKNNRNSIGILIWIRPHKEKDAPIEELEKLIINNRNLIHGLKFHPYCSRLKVTSKLLIPYFKLLNDYNIFLIVILVQKCFLYFLF